jgi:hypothetical protein
MIRHDRRAYTADPFLHLFLAADFPGRQRSTSPSFVKAQKGPSKCTPAYRDPDAGPMRSPPMLRASARLSHSNQGRGTGLAGFICRRPCDPPFHSRLSVSPALRASPPLLLRRHRLKPWPNVPSPTCSRTARATPTAPTSTTRMTAFSCASSTSWRGRRWCPCSPSRSRPRRQEHPHRLRHPAGHSPSTTCRTAGPRDAQAHTSTAHLPPCCAWALAATSERSSSASRSSSQM